MATSNFYQDGNNGLNVILIDDDDDNGDLILADTLQNIVDTINEMGYSVDAVHNWVDTPRSFDTGIQYAVYNKSARVIALLEVCAGYYSGGNINVYTGQYLKDVLDDDEDVSINKRDAKRVVQAVQEYTTGYKRTATFSNGESIYERA